ncbi:hypothetical protein ACM26V_03375 [Salipaludibacillus sp. HK11]|uniref:hypothetical protein n=1 Tax=Salipaludibacillus sp. HK11 TaxID=3394320 RepID=UPI0039FDDE2D
MLDLDKIREKIITLDDSDAKSIIMMIAAYLEMADDEESTFTSDKCVHQLTKLLNDILNQIYLKRCIRKNNKKINKKNHV